MPIHKCRKAVLECCFIFIATKFTFKSLVEVSLAEKVLNNLSRYRGTRKSLSNSLLLSSRIVSNKVLGVPTPLAPTPIPKWLKYAAKMGV